MFFVCRSEPCAPLVWLLWRAVDESPGKLECLGLMHAGPAFQSRLSCQQLELPLGEIVTYILQPSLRDRKVMFPSHAKSLVDACQLCSLWVNFCVGR